MYPDDLKQIMRSIRDGKEQSDFMMLQVHAHPTTGIGGEKAQPPDYLIEYAHDAIDNGADTFVATGPHQIGGIEIYGQARFLDWRARLHDPQHARRL